MDTETLRARYKPDRVQILLIGESPPVGGTFFYAANSNLFRYTREAFEAALECTWASDDDFLTFLKKCGFYLEDLCLEPVNGLGPADRRAVRRTGETPLAERLASLRPKAICVTPKAIARNAERAVSTAGLDAMLTVLPFPAMSWQAAYVSEMAAFLRRVHPDA